MAAPMLGGATKLKACEEVVIVATQGAEEQASGVGIYNVATGNQLQSWRGGSSSPQSLCLMRGEAVLGAATTKPIIHVWGIPRQAQKHRKLILGKKASCLAPTPDNNYLAAGLEDLIHIWQVCSGDLCSVLSHSSVEVACLKFSHTGEFLVSGYKDGTVAVWELQNCLHYEPSRLSEHGPLGTFVGHSGEITGLHITLSNKVASSSTDFTVKIWDILTLELLKTFELGAPICSIAIDQAELALYAGDQLGNIFCIDLNCQTKDKSVHIGGGDASEDSAACTTFKAHEGPVNHMYLTADQSKVVTASTDKMVKIWSMMSPVAPLIITLNDPVTDLQVAPMPVGLVQPEMKPRFLLGSLSRQLQSSGELTLKICGDEKVKFWKSDSSVHPQNQLESLIQEVMGANNASQSAPCEGVK